MSAIPDTIKIQGKITGVHVSSRGHGYVCVGESSSSMSDEQYNEAMAVFEREGYEGAHCKIWQKFMFQAFERALNQERKRVKAGDRR